MTTTIIVEAFGHLSPVTNLEGVIDDEEEDLYSVFGARSRLMSWYDPGMPTPMNRPPDMPMPPHRPQVWRMNEAELTAGVDGSRVGWAQVGLEAGVEPVVALPALIQCFDDALRRFGVVEISGLQVTTLDLEPTTRSCLGDLVDMKNWFNTALKARAGALIAFDQGFLGGHTGSEVFSVLQRWNTGSFEFGELVAVPEQHLVKAPNEVGRFHPMSPASDLGVPVMLPEWTASAAACALAFVINAARVSAPNVPNFVIRMTRTR